MLDRKPCRKERESDKDFLLKTLSQHIDSICRKKSSNCGNNLKQNFKAGEEKNISSTDSDDSIEITFASYATHVPKVAPKLEEINDNQFTDSCIRCKFPAGTRRFLDGFFRSKFNLDYLDGFKKSKKHLFKCIFQNAHFKHLV